MLWNFCYTISESTAFAFFSFMVCSWAAFFNVNNKGRRKSTVQWKSRVHWTWFLSMNNCHLARLLVLYNYWSGLNLTCLVHVTYLGRHWLLIFSAYTALLSIWRNDHTEDRVAITSADNKGHIIFPSVDCHMMVHDRHQANSCLISLYSQLLLMSSPWPPYCPKPTLYARVKLLCK